MRWFKQYALIFLVSLLNSSPAFCYGAMAIADFIGTNKKVPIVVVNEPSPTEARETALHQCEANTLHENCRIEISFSFEYLSVFIPTDGKILDGELFTAPGTTPEDARENALQLCRSARSGEQCRGDFLVWSDDTSPPAPRRPNVAAVVQPAPTTSPQNDVTRVVREVENSATTSPQPARQSTDIVAVVGESQYGWQLVAVPESSGSALEKCASFGWRSCRTIGFIPPGRCGSYATSPDGKEFRFAVASNLEEAKKQALQFCWPPDNNCASRWGQCNVGAQIAFTGSSIDGEYFARKRAAARDSANTIPKPQPPTIQPNTTAAPSVQLPPQRAQATSPPIVAQSSAPPVASETGIIEFRYLNYLSVGILAVLFMWLLWALSIRTPYDILQKYLSVALWSGLPILLAVSLQLILLEGAQYIALPPILITHLPASLQLYGIVYLLIYIANRARVTASPQEAEDEGHTFLRLPAFTVTIPVALALYVSQHQFKLDTEIAVCSLLTFTVFGIGYFIRPYDAVSRSVLATEQLQPETPAQQSIEPEIASQINEVETLLANKLPAVIPQATQIVQPMPPLEGIVLKLKRSQKTGAMGGLIYMLDARIDASQETLSLIAKHNLGGRLIYESEARQKHVAAAQGHLAATRGGPSLLAPASEQAKGAAGTIWKLGRAAVSAVRASLALRITVNSLLSGVHVECKSMEELLEAESAIREAKENLEGFLETAQTFDGREEIH
ncbi:MULTISPECIES: DUF4189 domain-containing protein [unclassified Bradyrhizobium]|uniref:DUF4189 domain-containing protein n=1 Tax=unclassified Bradyrhizobium TaxID=2631580 RepID=UPI002916E0D3|nr:MULTISPECIES: DUF4189 domain-containing protein [unclassified Bradyrhizobium]